MSSRKIPFFLITGFLGSGKTTLLKHILETFSSQHRIAVIENEFAAGNVDSIDLQLSTQPYKIVELNKGSVFCVCLLPEFTKVCGELARIHAPDAIFLEATGLADPIAVAQVLRSPPLDELLYLAHSYCIIDAVNFTKQEKAVTRVAHQVRIADTVLINKSDITEPAVIRRVEERVRELNPWCNTIQVVFCRFPFPSGSITGLLPLDKKDAGGSPEGRPDISTAVLRTTGKIRMEDLERLLCFQGDHILRIKGFVHAGEEPDRKTFAVQAVYGSHNVKEVKGYTGPTELVVLGKGSAPHEWEKRFTAACF